MKIGQPEATCDVRSAQLAGVLTTDDRPSEARGALYLMLQNRIYRGEGGYHRPCSWRASQ
jgi:hypothetical protein